MGPLLFKPEDSPTYGPGFKAVVITAVATAVIAVFYRYLCIWENKQRDKAGVLEAFEHAYEDDVTDRKVCFSNLGGAKITYVLPMLTCTCPESPIPVCLLSVV